MSRRIQIVTPENIEVTYELAGMGSRYVAVLVDHLLQILLVLLVSLAAGLLLGAASPFGRVVAGTASGYVQALVGLIVFFIIFGYFAAFEILWAGRTPGKRLAGLRVVRDGGYPIDPYSAIARNLIRIIDFLPAAYGVGLISIFISDRYKRLGDHAAGTLVIKERSPSVLGERPRVPASPNVVHLTAFVKSVDAVTPEEFRAIHRFVQRRHDLDLPVQAFYAMRIAYPLIQRLELDPPLRAQIHYADLLEAIERKYAEERGVLEGTTLE